jgi:putative flippase GtrA
LSFKKNAPMTDEQNYTLRVVGIKTDLTTLFIGIKNALIYMFIYFIALQVMRIIFQYILSGKIIWHPYKGLK